MNRIIKIILLAICFCVFVFSAYKIYEYFSEENESKELNDELIGKAITYVDINNNEESKSKENNISEPLTVDFSILKEENEDIVGWIYLENSEINYPVMQSNDNEYYLRRMYNKESNRAGSLFMDYRNNSNFEDDYTIIYGHNMKNSTMFGTLTEYENQEYYDNHKIMYYYTPEKNYIINIFAGFTTSVDSSIYELSFSEDKLSNITEKSDFESDVTVEKEDKIIVLSTCSYDYDDARYVVFGSLEELE